MTLPFHEKQQDEFYIRTFSKDLDPDELKWHWDEEDRTVIPVNETDWLFQRDNGLPEVISGEIFIKAGEWHRIIKGTGDLVVKVKKHPKEDDKVV